MLLGWQHRFFGETVSLAVVDSTTNGETSRKIATARVKLPLSWFGEFTQEGLVQQNRRFPVHPPTEGFTLAFEAFLTAGGATLRGPKGCLKFLMTQWSDFDHSAVGTVKLDSAFQAAREAYALSVAVFA